MDVDKEKSSTQPPETRWSIDLDWYQQNNRSFSALSQGCLCPKCKQRLSVEGKEVSVDSLLTTIKDCCSHVPGYITDQLPILESVFRLFLANGNQPLYIEELSRQLTEWRNDDAYRTSMEMLPRLIDNEQYYGLRPTKD